MLPMPVAIEPERGAKTPAEPSSPVVAPPIAIASDPPAAAAPAVVAAVPTNNGIHMLFTHRV